MKCHTAETKLSEYVDDALGQEERRALESHLAECSECRRELAALQRTAEAIRALPRHAAPSGFASRLMERVRAEDAAHASAPRMISLWPRLAAAAAVLLIVAGAILVVGRRGMPGTSAPALSPSERVAMHTVPTEREPDRVPAEEGEQWAEVPVSGDLLGVNGALPPGHGVPEGGPVAKGGRGAAAPGPTRSGLEKSGRGLSEELALGKASGEPGRFEDTERPALVGEAAPEVALGEPQKQADRERGRWAGEAGAKDETAKLGMAGGAAVEAGPRPDQMLTIVADDPVLVAAWAVQIADMNEATHVQVTALPGDGDQAEIVIALNVPGDNYDRFLAQVVEVAPPTQQHLANLRLAGPDAYFVQAAGNYERNRVNILRQQAVVARGASPKRPELAAAAEAEREERAAPAFREAKELGALDRRDKERLGAEGVTDSAQAPGPALSDDWDEARREVDGDAEQTVAADLELTTQEKQKEALRSIAIPREVRLVINLFRARATALTSPVTEPPSARQAEPGAAEPAGQQPGAEQ